MSAPSLKYELFGDGQHPIVLLHGFLGDNRDWIPIINRLSEKFRFLAIDLPGHGKSRDIGLDFNFAQTAAVILEILDQEKISTSSLLGYSMGGRIALYSAIHFPERFSRLILESASPGIKDDKERHERLAADQKIAGKLLGMPLADFLRDWYAMPLFDSIRVHPDLPALLERRAEHNPAALSRVLKNLGAGVMPPLWEKLRALPTPVHFIFGEKDKKYTNIANEMRGQNAGIFLHKIKNSGHNSHFENPAEFCNVLRKIFSEE